MVIGMIRALYNKWRLMRYVGRGLQIADDCRLINLPDFGSEPYLISIGKHVTVCAGVAFINHDGGTWVFRQLPRYRDVIKFGRIVIHDNCFIGLGATIMPGVSIGPNSVIAARSVVTTDVPANTVAAGAPARVMMTLEEYAEKALAHMVPYDVQAYKANKIVELLRLFPRPW